MEAIRDMDEVISLIQKANNIQISKEKFRPVYEQMTYCTKGRNQIVSQIGDSNTRLCVILSGIVRLYYIDREGNDITRFFGTKGCISGGTEDRLPYAVETLKDCEFLMMDGQKLKEIIGEELYWFKIWNQLLQNSISYKIYRESCFLTKSATERYIDFRRLHPDLEKQVKQSFIASYLGITPVSLSRIRRIIQEEG